MRNWKEYLITFILVFVIVVVLIGSVMSIVWCIANGHPILAVISLAFLISIVFTPAIVLG